jgi:hypothetical protein
VIVLMGWGLVVMAALSIWADLALAAVVCLILAMMLWVGDRQEMKRIKDDQ